MTNPLIKIWLGGQFAVSRLVTFFWSTWYNVMLRIHPAVRLQGWLRVSGRMRLHVDPRASVVIGRGVRLNSGSLLNAVGGHRPIVIAVHKGASLEIGADTGISSSTLVALTGIRIGKRVLIGGDCCIYDSDFHALNAGNRKAPGRSAVCSQPVAIEDEVFIGTQSLILKNTVIGRGAVIGAGSLVPHVVPPDEIWAGHPARFIRRIAIESYEPTKDST